MRRGHHIPRRPAFWFRFGRRRLFNRDRREQVEDAVQSAVWAAAHSFRTAAYVLETMCDNAPSRARRWRDAPPAFEEDFPR